MARITKGKRRRVLERDGKKCKKCGVTENLTIDHIIPTSKGGHHGISNMQTLCFDCNVEKGDLIKLYKPSSVKQRKSLKRWCNILDLVHN